MHERVVIVTGASRRTAIGAAAAREAFGHVDALVANHARSSTQDLEGPTAAELHLSWALNTRATPLLVQAFAAQHEDTRRGGRVLLLTSGQHHGATPAELPRTASEAALHEPTRSLAVHLAPRGATVDCIDPGPHDTARLIAWRLSDEADWVTGRTTASDGGWSSR
ncbi:SDR family oxidoreductase [Kineococcus indalonis]|uniref:SDR family oxidoreductase n=1 Tax=Kineococcus indalonis TaxID=2696566 RepID=UPI001411CF0B|nr:SDR family oxidoreductase [Kineococcus indalonis]NAZ84842.1 SDR family oxidoreductase [Kineococcus indalonis]